MGWQQKGTGRKRNSESSHAFVIGSKDPNIIAKSLCSKGCGFCKSWHRRHSIDLVPPLHNCFKNCDGDSGAMEPKAIPQMCEWLHSQHVTVGSFVVDDDSSMKAKLKRSNKDHMVNTGTTVLMKS